MKKARIHIRMGVIELPERHLEDGEVVDDIIDVALNDNERVVQVDLDKQAVYRQARSDSPHPFTGQPRSREVTVRDRNLVRYRYRISTIEELTGIAPGSAEEPTDAEVVDHVVDVYGPEELPNG